jgi:hypothetical protein
VVASPQAVVALHHNLQSMVVSSPQAPPLALRHDLRSMLAIRSWIGTATSWTPADPLPVPCRSCPTVGAHKSSLQSATGPATLAKVALVSEEEVEKERVGACLRKISAHFYGR